MAQGGSGVMINYPKMVVSKEKYRSLGEETSMNDASLYPRS